MATMKDIARLAGVSVATVSYCINGTKPVKPATRDRIMEAVAQLGYVPNESARSLREEQSRELGVVFPDIEDLSRSEVLKGIVAAAEEADYALQIAFSYNSPKLERKILERMIGKRVAGLILVTCQPENTAYFRNTLVTRNLPVVFLDRAPAQIDANFLAFDNDQACRFLTGQLLERGYRRLALLCGPRKLFSEQESIRGFTGAVEERGGSMDSHPIWETEISKEAAFRLSMLKIVEDPPQAIVSTSELMTLGLLEALQLAGIAVPERTVVLTLGADCWNTSNYHPAVLHTARAAYAMGESSVRLLADNIRKPQFFEKQFRLFHDNVVDGPLVLPPPPQVLPPRPPERRLRVLSPHLPTTDAMQAVSCAFGRDHGIRVDIEQVSYQALFQAIDTLAGEPDAPYDLYFFDVSWLEYVARRGVFADLTEFYEAHPAVRQSLMPKNLQNCQWEGRYCGFPVVGGSHLLFYRRDLFDDPFVRRQFEAMYHAPLRLPRTWTEFNAIARFFTRDFNPYSPTVYGTTVIGSIHEECALELLVRLWSFGGDLFDAGGMPALSSPQNVKGFRSLLESCRYADPKIARMTIEESFAQFGAGQTAMLLSFTEYATMIRSNIEADVISSVDCAMLPGQTPANVGWNMGIARHSPRRALALEWMEWLCQKQTSYYMTILNGQSVMTDPHQNHELRKLFPWLALVQAGQDSARDRRYPILGRRRLHTPAETENILFRLFHQVLSGALTVQQALDQGQQELLQLLKDG